MAQAKVPGNFPVQVAPGDALPFTYEVAGREMAGAEKVVAWVYPDDQDVTYAIWVFLAGSWLVVEGLEAITASAGKAKPTEISAAFQGGLRVVVLTGTPAPANFTVRVTTIEA